ncbi:MAG: multi-sensor signal transduction histidine kinase [Ignavibacteria bacterium]|nr:MAG: multi-sensor signal transduction histidine kinase [Ignavibacteria bacterium]KAF0161577.1 MAG: multi-sensor signal transduction histidine kinase [Ignavibacteria bacterium]
MGPESLISVENPIFFGLFLMAVMIMVILVYNRFIIIPLKKKHLAEEENLKLQQAELMALFASLSPDPIFRFDETGKIILANNSAHKIFPHEILLGEQVQTILPFTENYNLQEVIDSAKTLMNTITFEKNHYQFLIVGSPKFKMCQVYGRDITELKLTEQDLKEALLKAEESKKVKEFFLAQISHEIRSPLNVIVGYSDLVSDELKDTDRADLINILKSVKNNSKRLYRTFDLLLNMSQLQAGRYDARIERVNLFALLNTIYAEYASFAEEKGLKIFLTNKAEENLIINCDYYSITQVFVNLIDNAIKYTKQGSVEIKIYRETENINVDIIDTGKGMSQEYMEKLFVPFTQEEMGYTRRFDGTGLGLAIANSFIKINNAKIRLTSEQDKGTTFTVILNGDKLWGNYPKKNQNF